MAFGRAIEHEPLVLAQIFGKRILNGSPLIAYTYYLNLFTQAYHNLEVMRVDDRTRSGQKIIGLNKYVNGNKHQE